MQNFHFNPTSNKSVQLMKELQAIDQDLQQKKMELQKKKLEQQFYQDTDYVNNKYQNGPSSQPGKDNNLSLADEIMNELMRDNKSKKPEAIRYNLPKSPVEENNYKPQVQMYDNLKDFNMDNKFAGHYDNVQSQGQEAPFQPRQNNFMHQNKRQMQKQKLQNPSSNQQNPFIGQNQPVRRSVEPIQQKPIINQRQLEKQKLQQGSQQQNMFWGENRQRSMERPSNPSPNVILPQRQNPSSQFSAQSPRQMAAEKDVNSQNLSKKAAFENRYSNPFVKDEEDIKQRREEQQREYRRALEEQKKAEEERKNREKQMVKQQKYAFNAYQPGSANNSNTPATNQSGVENASSAKSPSVSVTKKIDPNGKPPSFDYNQLSNKVITAADQQYMKMKATQLKDNFKKGRILYDEYMTQIKKLADYYKVDYRELIDRKAVGDDQEREAGMGNGNNVKVDNISANLKPAENRKSTNVNLSNPSLVQPKNFQILENQQSLQRFPDSQASLPSHQPSSPSKNFTSDPYNRPYPQNPSYTQQYNPYPNIYTQNLSNPPYQQNMAATSFMQQMPSMDYELMRRMFEELKAMRTDYTKSLQSEKAFFQQVMLKIFNQQSVGQSHQQNPHMNQNPQQNYANNSPKPNKRQNILPQNSQQHLTEQSLDYIQKSLSGVVNKIPFYSNSTNRKEDPSFLSTPQQSQGNVPQPTNKNVTKVLNQQNTQTLQQFFAKPYKVKPFKKFSIMVDASQSSMVIPSVSNFLASKNGKDVVNKLFQDDLLAMKKLQRQKQVQKLRNRVQTQLSYQQPTMQSKYMNSPTVVNYADTFNNPSLQNPSQNPNQSSKNKEKSTKPTTISQYENYSRKGRDIKSAQGHRTYKKTDGLPDSGFLKRHVSNNEDNLPDFADQSDIKARSPVYYSPKLSSQILEQDEYQTAQKELESEFYGKGSPKESTNKKYKMKKKDFAYEEERQSEKKGKEGSPTFNVERNKSGSRERSRQKSKPQSAGGIMNMLKQNDQVLRQYAVSPKNLQDYSEREEVDIRDYSSIGSNPPKDEQLGKYFSGNANNGSQPKTKIATSNTSNNNSNPPLQKQLSNKFNSQKYQDNQQSYHSVQESLQQIQSQNYSSNHFPKPVAKQSNNLRIEQSDATVKSIQYSVSSARHGGINISQTVESIEESTSRMPPLNKKKSTSRKKESSIVRTKFQNNSILQRPPVKESQASYDPQGDVVVGGSPLKFDSHVYDSEYEQSVEQKDLQGKIAQLQSQQRQVRGQITVSPPVIITPKGNDSLNQTSKVSVNSNKLKSLQQARNLAKQCKRKSTSTQNDQIFKYQQKMSELESFLTRRDDSIIKQTKQTKTIKLAIQKSPQKNKKNIMNLLDQLQNESSYRDDFQSYREESERGR